MSEQVKTITREDLYERIWKMPATKLAKEFGISDVALAKICRKLNVPKPGPGHWRLVQLGWEIERTPMPTLEAGATGVATINPEPHRKRITGLSRSDVDEKEKPQFEVVPVAETLHKAHELVSRMHRSLDSETPNRIGLVEVSWRLRVLNVSVSRGQTTRALRIMDALMKALERRGATFVKDSEREFMNLMVGEESVGVALTELVNKSERQPKDEKERESWSWKWDKWQFQPTGRLEFRIFESEPKGARRCWSDCTRYKLEEKLGEILERIFITADGKTKVRLAWEEARRRREEEWKRQEEQERQQERIRKRAERKRQIEQDNRDRLEASAQAWIEAKGLRRFIRECEEVFRKDKKTPPGDWQNRWLAWAREHANRLDPMTNGFLEAERGRFLAPNVNKEDETD
jgi:hypothetical protein